MTPSQQCPNHQAVKTIEVLHFLSSPVYLELLGAEWLQHQQKGQHIPLCLCISKLVVQRHSWRVPFHSPSILLQYTDYHKSHFWMEAAGLVPLTLLCRYHSELLSPVTQETWWKHSSGFLTPSLDWLPTHNRIYQENRQNLEPTISARRV